MRTCAWGNIMADSEIWQVLTFLNQLDNFSAVGSAGTPSACRQQSLSGCNKPEDVFSTVRWSKTEHTR